MGTIGSPATYFGMVILLLLAIGVILKVFIFNKQRDSIPVSFFPEHEVLLSEDEEEKIEDYFRNLGSYFSSSFVREMLLYEFSSLPQDTKNHLLNTFPSFQASSIGTPVDIMVFADKPLLVRDYYRSKAFEMGIAYSNEETHEITRDKIKKKIAANTYHEVLRQIYPYLVNHEDKSRWDEIIRQEPKSLIL